MAKDAKAQAGGEKVQCRRFANVRISGGVSHSPVGFARYVRQSLPRMEFCQILTEEIKWGVKRSDEKGSLPDQGGSARSLYPVCYRRGSGRPSKWSRVMKKLLVKLVKDEAGGEVLEYALIAGLIVVAAIAVIGTVGTKVLARWTSLNSSL